jgi:hypothetical protein
MSQTIEDSAITLEIDTTRFPDPCRLSLGDGRPSRGEENLCLVSHRVSGDWNFYMARASFDFRCIETRDGVYMRGLRI